MQESGRMLLDLVIDCIQVIEERDIAAFGLLLLNSCRESDGYRLSGL